MDLSLLGQTNQSVDDFGDEDEDDDASAESPHLVYQSSRTAIYRFKDKGIKVLVDPNPSEEQILQLVHEHNISKFLPSVGCRNRKRHVLDVKGFKGDPAIYFQWTRGKTLAEWLVGKARRRSDDVSVDLNVRLKAAIAIVETLYQFHDGGVVYNNLSPSNIVLDTSDGSYVANFIDLSEAIIYYDKDEEFASKVREIDLKSLGTLFNQLFCSAIDPASEADQSLPSNGQLEETKEEAKDEPNTRKRGKQPSPGEGLPMYLGTLISTLLNTGESGDGSSSSKARYESAKDVLLHLNVAGNNPEAYLKPLVLDGFLARGRLQLQPDAFYGRQSEISMLLHALSSVTTLGGKPMMASISGSPGTGKTSLVNQIKKPLQNANGFFVQGKFDERTTAVSVIFSALDACYSEILSEGRQDTHHELKSRILKSIGVVGCSVLMNPIPSLQAFMGDDCVCSVNSTDTTSFALASTEQRWKYLLCKLIAATSSESSPLAIFLDDLQWADDTSLDVIRMLVTDPDIRYCLFVGVYRDNQSTSNTRLKKLLYEVQEQGVSLISIKIGSIEKECVNTLLSETLCLPPRSCQSLSTIIHSKTRGIALFVTRFLKSLNEEGLLWFNLSSRRWEYDSDGIEQKEILKDVVEHMSERITRLPQGMQLGLKLSACLGSKFDAFILERGTPENDIDINEFLCFAVEGGYLQKISPGKYMWTHDQIQQAAYELIADAKRESFHLLLGSRIFLRSTPEELDRDVFTIVGNMNIGVRLIKSQGQKLEVARLNLRAGEMAIASSSFKSAAKYLMLAIGLLPDEIAWREDYGFAIRLYDAATEALYVTGDFETLSSIIQIPLYRARCFEDKLNIYHILVRFLFASGQMREGISKSVGVLVQLGETIPEKVTSSVYAEEVQLVKRSLMDLSEDDLLGLPLMTDERKLACMQFLSHTVSAAYTAEPLLAPVVVFRMVRLSIEHGICNISAFAFGLYGAWLVSAINSDFDGGHRMGRLAITLLNRLEANEYIPRVYTSVYAFINIWKEPFQSSLAKHLEGYDAGALSGDTEFGISCLYQYSLCALNNCGEELGTLEKSIRLYIRRAVQCSQIVAAKFLVILHQQTFALMGSSESSYSIFFDTTEDVVYQESVEKNQIAFCRYIIYKRKFLAFLYGDMDAAAKYYEMGIEYPIGANGRLSHISLGIVIDGLIAFFFARAHHEDRNRWQHIGEAVIDVTRQWAKNTDWNFINKVYLLEAEYYFTKNEEIKAIETYEKSIKAAQEHHFIHEEGLAFERAAWFHLHYGRNGEALECFTQSKKCYQSWGAHGLVDHIEREILKLI